jgi:hypothetical protein
MTTYIDAINDMWHIFKTAWDSKTTAVVGYVPVVFYPGMIESKPDASKFWVRISQRTIMEGQTTLTDSENKKTYTSEGLIFIQLFCPKTNSSNFQLGRRLAEIARNAYRGNVSHENIIFRNGRIQEFPNEESYFYFRIVIEYEYDEKG